MATASVLRKTAARARQRRARRRAGDSGLCRGAGRARARAPYASHATARAPAGTTALASAVSARVRASPTRARPRPENCFSARQKSTERPFSGIFGRPEFRISARRSKWGDGIRKIWPLTGILAAEKCLRKPPIYSVEISVAVSSQNARRRAARAPFGTLSGSPRSPDQGAAAEGRGGARR